MKRAPKVAMKRAPKVAMKRAPKVAIKRARISGARYTHGFCRSAARILLIVVGTAILAPTSGTLAFQSDPAAEKVDAMFAAWDRPGSPGCALGVIRDGQLIYKKGYGMANLDWSIPITPTTVFYVGSVSKQFTAATVALLSREGELSLDDDIREHLPEMPEYGAPVTVRHLIHHTSGVRDLYSIMRLKGLSVADVFTDKDGLELLANQSTLNFKPGDEFLYSNGGYFLLSEIVERASGTTFSEYAEEEIFGPLGMKDSHFHNDPGHVVERRAMSYETDGDGGFAQNYLSNFNKVGPGGLYTTVEDLLLWDGNFYDNQLDGEGFIELMLTGGTLNDGEELDYALALVHGEYQGLKTIDHAGGMMGFRADLLRFPEQRFSVVCLCNLANINPSQLTRRVADLYLAEEFRDHFEEYEGEYRNDDLEVTYSILFRDGALFVELPGSEPQRLNEVDEDKFQMGGFWTVEFQRGSSDEVQEFTVDIGRARGVRFLKISETAD